MTKFASWQLSFFRDSYVISLKTKSCNANFVITGDTSACHNNLRWGQSWHHDDSVFSDWLQMHRVHELTVSISRCHLSSIENPNCGYKIILWPFCLHCGISYTGKRTFFIESGPRFCCFYSLLVWFLLVFLQDWATSSKPKPDPYSPRAQAVSSVTVGSVAWYTDKSHDKHWNGNFVILMEFSSLAALKVVLMTTFSAVSEQNFVKMIFSFQWLWGLECNKQGLVSI